jgi:hypothetical protein
MILEEKIIIIFNGRYKKYYEDLGYVFENKKTEILVSDLLPNSLVKILVKCDICGKERRLRYQDYQKITKMQTEPYNCQKCVKQTKTKFTLIKKYGVDNISKSDLIKEKKIKTCLENYNVDNPSKSIIIKNKKIETSLNNCGFEYPSQNRDTLYKRLKNGFTIKHIDHLYYQGSYEKEFIIKYKDKIKLENGLSIMYIYMNEEKIYHSDFYIPTHDLVIEVKSTYWYNKNLEMCKTKEKYTKERHNYIMILDKNYAEFEALIKS